MTNLLLSNNLNLLVGIYDTFFDVNGSLSVYVLLGLLLLLILLYYVRYRNQMKSSVYNKLNYDRNTLQEEKLASKDIYSFEHSNNVSLIAIKIARKAGLSKNDIRILHHAALLHDVGKVRIPEGILLKPGFLDEDEIKIMKSHVFQSVDIVRGIENFSETIPVILSHHERYDGGGYPKGLKGEDIPVLGRIVCIADSIDAMITDRPYRKKLSLLETVEELKKNKGKQFDPYFIDLFISILNTDGSKWLKIDHKTTIL